MASLKLSVDISLISTKICYALVIAREFCLPPFMILFLTSVGLTPTQAGIVNGVRYIGALLGAPVIGLYLDHIRRPRFVFISICLLVIALVDLQPVSSLFFAPHKMTLFSNATSVIDHHHDHHDHNSLFYMFFALNAVASLFEGSIKSIIDTETLLKIQNAVYPISFGWQRAFGSPGAGLTWLVMSILVAYLPKNLFSPYAPIFLVHALIHVSLIFSFAHMSRRGGRTYVAYESAPLHDGSTVSLFVKHMSEPTTWLLLITVFFLGLQSAFITTFLSLWCEEQGAPRILPGLALFISTFGTFIGNVSSSQICRWLGGPWLVYLTTLTAWFCVFMGIYFAENPWLSIPLVSLFELGFGMSFPTVFTHINESMPTEVLTTFCSIANTLLYFTSNALVNFVGVPLYQKYGSHNLFLGVALLAAPWCMVLFIYIIKKNSTKPNSEENLNQAQE